VLLCTGWHRAATGMLRMEDFRAFSCELVFMYNLKRRREMLQDEIEMLTRGRRNQFCPSVEPLRIEVRKLKIWEDALTKIGIGSALT
jgi:hypothetical protein